MIFKNSSIFLLGLLTSKAVFSQEIGVESRNRIMNAKQGTIVELPNFLTENFKHIAYDKIIQPGPQFMISDDPEYIRIPEGIALKESVKPGAVRLYVYNVNGVKEPKKIERKITAIIKNTGNKPLTIKMLKYSSQLPSTDYFFVGKNGLSDYFSSNGKELKDRKVAPGEVIAIDPKLEKHVVKYDELVHGFYEFIIDQPAEIAVLQTSPEKSSAKAYTEIKTAIPSNHKNAGRGLFGVSNYKIFNQNIINTAEGVSQLVLADGKTDPWVVGIEGESGKISKLAGNYGVIYDIDLQWKSTDGKGLALVTWNSRAGDNKWCSGMAASMVTSAGVFKEGVVQLPSDKLITKSEPEVIVIQVFKPKNIGEVETLNLKYSPPGASCLPTPLIFIPVDL
ncbi:hypothetical protein Pedsa_0013 [Pseudopedobacter saltans DSM 12145]|uniref:Copper amine oxidase n=1 Tax=Pseudopedobacter saltans (strain ATCC 51119 / DSM 12145 / JCM 21818 / CCUG 39354 / LMG 10337 / NBRC 100064 / NCIMB 13643) TaxID=762903 RepID=F0SC17_PSESL|nr:hypothetical protein [Pseudopedobacter saltans]ADY50602.1 hypothetical protein Pedsa_0013 [Pseudopedobacter saltans DSM 12145]